MKKVLGLVVVMFAAFLLVACTDTKTVLVDDAHTYYATGQFASWGDAVGNTSYQMIATNRGDARLKSISSDLKDAKFIYVLEVVLPSEDAGWNVTYKIDGEVKELNGNLTVKVIQTNVGAEAPNWWGQSPESGEIKSLTPDTLYLPPFVEENVDEAGGWNDNPVALEAGTYYMVYVQYSNTSHGFGLIKK